MVNFFPLDETLILPYIKPFQFCQPITVPCKQVIPALDSHTPIYASSFTIQVQLDNNLIFFSFMFILFLKEGVMYSYLGLGISADVVVDASIFCWIMAALLLSHIQILKFLIKRKKLAMCQPTIIVTFIYLHRA